MHQSLIDTSDKTVIRLQWGLQVTEAPLPPVADAYMGYMRLRIAEELAWMKGSPLYALLGASDKAAEHAGLHSSLLGVSILFTTAQ